MKKATGILLFLGLYLLSAGGAYLFFSHGSLIGKKQMSAPPPIKNANGSVSFDDNLPKTEPCPMNGVKYSTQQREWWENHRPLLIMIENHENARPQSGISKADVTYEAVAEGGITRTMNLFYCQDGGQVGPVRSARTYFLDWASEYGDHPLYTHVGGANTDGKADALGQIDDYGWGGYNDMNQFSIGFPTFWRDYNRLGHETATEHTMYSTTDKLWEFAAKQRGLTTVDKEGVKWDTGFVPYTFKDDTPANAADATQIHIEFWEGYKDYMVDWTYNKATNDYKRNNGGVAHIDKDTNKQLIAKTIVVMYMDESHANDGYENNAHLLYNNKGRGKAVVFMDGKQIKANWSKKSRTDRTIITDSTGKEIQFNRGKLWFEILPLDGVLTVK
jgi:hypothetical protein